MKIPRISLYKIYVSSAIESAMWAFTAGPVCRYFMDLLGEQYPQTCNTILGYQTSAQVALAALVQASVSCSFITSRFDYLDWFKKYFGTLILLDAVVFTIISLLSEDCVIVRFLGFAIFSTITTQIWNLVNGNQINRLFCGEELTRFNARLNCIRQGAAFVGGLLLVAIGSLVLIHSYITIQCLVIWIVAALDYSAFRDIQNILEK